MISEPVLQHYHLWVEKLIAESAVLRSTSCCPLQVKIDTVDSLSYKMTIVLWFRMSRIKLKLDRNNIGLLGQ